MAKVELTHELVADIKQKAKAAQELAPGTWHGGPDGDHWVLVDSQRGVFHTTCKERNIAEFIAYADPATVLAMVEEIEQLTKTSQELFDKTKALEQEIEQIKRQAENNVKHVPYYTGKGPLEQVIEILGTRELNKVIQSRKESEAGQ